MATIDDVLDFSKIEAGRLELESRPLDLRNCVESALELVAASASSKKLDLAYFLDPGVPGAIVGDATRLRQILVNLLNNAVKFTEKGEVVLSVDAEVDGEVDGEALGSGDGQRERKHKLHFAVRDSGIGIPEDRLSDLFDSFSQVDASTTRRYGGTGLGLAISKRLSELMGGTIWVDSRVGEGSTFHFTIEAGHVPGGAPAHKPVAPAQLHGRRVLIVDDNATNRDILVRQTESWGLLARATPYPVEALEWIRRGEPFDVAVLDMQMPEMDGVTLAEEMRRYRDPRTLPLVMLTSLGPREAVRGGVEFAAHLTKPIKPAQLYETLLTVFGAAPAGVPAAAPREGPVEQLAERMPLRILVAEDNVVNQQLALLLLKKIGYRADMAANGLEALEALEREPYDVVVMDVQMPKMDGLEATRRIHRRWPEGPRPHIIAATANAIQEEREACLAAGMDDYLSKPIRLEELTAALSRFRPHLAPRPPARASDPGPSSPPPSPPETEPHGQPLAGRVLDSAALERSSASAHRHLLGRRAAARRGCEEGAAARSGRRNPTSGAHAEVQRGHLWRTELCRARSCARVTGQVGSAGRNGRSHRTDRSGIRGGQDRSGNGAGSGRTMTEGPGFVLVVDDDAVNRLLLSRGLERDGHRVRTVANGLEALEALRDELFDCVLLDVLMPEMDGYQVLEHIRNDPRLRHTPVIMISALEDVESVVRCIEMGAEDYLPKPFDAVLLRARINAGLARKRLADLEQEYLSRWATSSRRRQPSRRERSKAGSWTASPVGTTPSGDSHVSSNGWRPKYERANNG
jgi:CheY-like chemotaxis protein